MNNFAFMTDAKSMLKSSVNSAAAPAGDDRDRVVSISLDKIKLNPLNANMPKDNVDVIAESIQAIGLLHPINVWGPDDDGFYHLWDGEQRLLAYRQLGKNEIPALISPSEDWIEADKEKAFAMWLDPNVARREIVTLQTLLACYHNAEAVARHHFEQLSINPKMEDLMAYISKLLHNLPCGTSVPQLYKLQQAESLDPSLLTLDEYGVSWQTAALANSLVGYCDDAGNPSNAPQVSLRNRVVAEASSLKEKGKDPVVSRDTFVDLLKDVKRDFNIGGAKKPDPEETADELPEIETDGELPDQDEVHLKTVKKASSSISKLIDGLPYTENRSYVLCEALKFSVTSAQTQESRDAALERLYLLREAAEEAISTLENTDLSM